MSQPDLVYRKSFDFPVSNENVWKAKDLAVKRKALAVRAARSTNPLYRGRHASAESSGIGTSHRKSERNAQFTEKHQAMLERPLPASLTVASSTGFNLKPSHRRNAAASAASGSDPSPGLTADPHPTAEPDGYFRPDMRPVIESGGQI
jgi:hypothetical protein